MVVVTGEGRLHSFIDISGTLSLAKHSSPLNATAVYSGNPGQSWVLSIDEEKRMMEG